MLLAIDVGNTHSVYGVWTGTSWLATWRRSTNSEDTEDQLAVWLKSVCDLAGVPFAFDEVICASVVPPVDDHLEKLATKWLGAKIQFLRGGAEVGVNVSYDPPHAVGADRLANALGALDRFKPPIIVVDFGTATTFDSIDATGTYVGGAILPGIAVSTNALIQHAAKLPQFELVAPASVLGKNTVHSLQSGVMIGYAGAIDALATRISAEMGGQATVVATGGLGSVFLGLCSTIKSYEPMLTLEGLVIAQERLRK